MSFIIKKQGAYRCSPVLMFPSPDFPRPYIPQFLYSPAPFFPQEVRPMFPSLFVTSPLASQSLCSPAPLFPSLDIAHKWFPVPMLPKNVPRLLDILFPRPDLPQNCLQSQFNPKIFPRPCFPPSSSPAPMFHSPCLLGCNNHYRGWKTL